MIRYPQIEEIKKMNIIDATGLTIWVLNDIKNQSSTGKKIVDNLETVINHIQNLRSLGPADKSVIDFLLICALQGTDKLRRPDKFDIMLMIVELLKKTDNIEDDYNNGKLHLLKDDEGNRYYGYDGVYYE